MKFDRTKRKGWMIASSLSCPDCGNRLWGDKEFAWCKAYDCTFYCEWHHLNLLYEMKVKMYGLHTLDLRGVLRQFGENTIRIYFDGIQWAKYKLWREGRDDCEITE